MILFNALCAITLWNLISSIFYLKNKPTKLTLYCGLIGYSGKKNFNKDKINLVMLWNSFERGRDSTGIYSPKNNLIKEADPAAKFLGFAKSSECAGGELALLLLEIVPKIYQSQKV